MEDAMSFKATHLQTVDPQPAVDSYPGSPRNKTSNPTTPAPEPLDLAARHVLRQEELLAARFADPDPAEAVLASVSVDTAACSSLLFNAIKEAATIDCDPAHRLAALLPGMRTYAVFVRLVERLN